MIKRLPSPEQRAGKFSLNATEQAADSEACCAHMLSHRNPIEVRLSLVNLNILLGDWTLETTGFSGTVSNYLLSIFPEWRAGHTARKDVDMFTRCLVRTENVGVSWLAPTEMEYAPRWIHLGRPKAPSSRGITRQTFPR